MAWAIPRSRNLAPPSVSAFTASRSKPIRSGWLFHQREPLRVKAASQSESQNDTQNESQNDTQKRDLLAEKIIAAMKANPEATRADIAKQAGVSLATIARKLKEMNCIRYVGSSKKGHWEVDD